MVEGKAEVGQLVVGAVVARVADVLEQLGHPDVAWGQQRTGIFVILFGT